MPIACHTVDAQWIAATSETGRYVWVATGKLLTTGMTIVKHTVSYCSLNNHH